MSGTQVTIGLSPILLMYLSDDDLKSIMEELGFNMSKCCVEGLTTGFRVVFLDGLTPELFPDLVLRINSCVRERLDVAKFDKQLNSGCGLK